MSETALLVGVRNVIRSVCGLKEIECNVEYDDLPPTGAGERYVAVCPGGVQPGPNNDIGGGVLDEIYAVDVTVVLRAPKMPRDRQRELFIDHLTGLNALTDRIKAAIHFNIPTIFTEVNKLIAGNQQKFIEMLKYGGMDAKPTPVGGEYFNASGGEDVAGLKRTIRFHKARRIQYVTNIQ